MEDELIIAIAGLAAFLMFLINNNEGNEQGNNQCMVRRRKRVWQRGILKQRTKKSQFYTIMQELNDGNVNFWIMLLTYWKPL